MIEVRSAFVENERTRKILDGTVCDDRIALNPIALAPGEMFLRQLKYAEFDVSELSLSSLMIASLRGPSAWWALPIFTTRQFFHTGILVREDSPIAHPEDLRGRRVGVLEYQQTAAVWIRGALQHEFGIRDVDLDWFMERRPAASHGGATGFTPPEGVRLTYVPSESSLAAMLMDRTIDAILFYPPEVDGVDRRSDGARRRLRTRTLRD
jgi:4,5-dihydroxyphthalate decarboxylase